MLKNLKNINSSLKSSLDKERYLHTVSVSYTAMCLAMRYEVDLHKAEIAGLLHDCAKCISNEKKLKECQKHNIRISDAEQRKPDLLHAKLGAFIAMDEYEVDDKEIINAILKHTTGAPNMTMLEKIIFVADYIEPRREKAENLPFLRKLAFEDIDACVYFILEDTLSYLKKKQCVIDTMTDKAYEFYKTLYEEQHMH